MANSKSRRALFCTLFFSLVVLCTATAPPPAISPSTEAELICHTDNPADCYPKVFSATEEFQVVHDDQDLPPGLHVQLDMQTGAKQAKLYDPSDEHPELRGLPVDQEIIVVDPEISTGADAPKIRPGAPAYEPVGVVKQPQHKDPDFFQALLELKEFPAPKNIQYALEVLEEWSYDMYYGLQIAEDTQALQSLFCVLTDGKDPTMVDGAKLLASSTLASVLRNNPPALRAVERSWGSVMQTRCNTSSETVGSELLLRLDPTSEPDSLDESREVDQIRIILPVLYGLFKSPDIRNEFIEKGVMQSLLRILVRQGEMWEPRRAKVAQIVSDTFLDEDLGASLGVWPQRPQQQSDSCAQNFDDECWQYHLKKLTSRKQPPDWLNQFLELLQKQTTPLRDIPPEHKEL